MSAVALLELEQFLVTVFGPFALWAGGGMLGICLCLMLANSIRRIFRI
jgi:hypothetical protein